jgi:phosphopantetheinyl transferase
VRYEEKLTQRCLSVLSDGERSRAASLLQPEDRHRFAQRRALHRWLGDVYASEDAGKNDFFTEDHAVNPTLQERSLFSDQPQLSCGHPAISWTTTDHLCIAGVSRVASIGIDAEVPSEAIDFQAIAQAEFTIIESSLIDAKPRGEAQALFFRLWRMKEAGLKFYGRGLREGLACLSFQENQRGELYLAHMPSAWGDPHQLYPRFFETTVFGFNLAVALPAAVADDRHCPIATATP